MTSFAATMGQKDFSKATLKSFGKAGVRVTGVQMVPGSGDLPWANATKCYTVDDNGTGRVLSYDDLFRLAHERLGY